MTYTSFFLFSLGLAGIVLHFLVKLDSLNRKHLEINWRSFFLAERFSILISFIVIAVATMLSQEIRQLEVAGKWLGLGMLSIGYTSQSLLVKTMCWVQGYINGKDTNVP